MTSGCENSNTVSKPTASDSIPQIDVVCFDDVRLYSSFTYFFDNVSEARNDKDYCGGFDYLLELKDSNAATVNLAVFEID